MAFSSSKEWVHQKWVVSASKEKIKLDFEGWGPKVHGIIEAMQKPDIWALFYHPPASTFHKGRICLLGDSAHATTPHHGAGAGMCIEDALVLGELIKETNSVDDLMRAFAVFDKVRRPRTQRNVKESKEAGELYDFELLGDNLDEIQKDFTSRMSWIWDIDLDEEVQRAKKLYFDSDSGCKADVQRLEFLTHQNQISCHIAPLSSLNQ